MSPQYLSEVERGLKEPSSEMIAAIVGALGVTLIDLTLWVSDDLRQREHTRPYVAPSGAHPQSRSRHVHSEPSVSAADALVTPFGRGAVLLAA